MVARGVKSFEGIVGGIYGAQISHEIRYRHLLRDAEFPREDSSLVERAIREGYRGCAISI